MSPKDARCIQKTRLRRELRAQRLALGAEVRERASAELCEQLLQSPVFVSARHVAAYWALGAELSVTWALQEKINQGARVYLPRVNEEDQLDFVDAGQLDDLRPGAFGILEPRGPAVDLADISVFLVPGVAFDRRGHRLGSGRGYYDRALAGVTHAKLIGVGYDGQLLDEDLPDEAHDRPMDIIATGKRWHVPASPSPLHTSKE